MIAVDIVCLDNADALALDVRTAARTSTRDDRRRQDRFAALTSIVPLAGDRMPCSGLAVSASRAPA
jgi:hypothetical protein